MFGLGLVSVALGVIGIFLPLLPTTPFLLVATWCFVRSSVRAHRWLYNHPLFGSAIRDWEVNRAIARRTKVVAIMMIAASILVIWWRVRNLWIASSVTVFLLLVSTFIATRRERR